MSKRTEFDCSSSLTETENKLYRLAPNDEGVWESPATNGKKRFVISD